MRSPVSHCFLRATAVARSRDKSCSSIVVGNIREIEAYSLIGWNTLNVMETPPLFITDDQRRKDNEHIKLLSVFHFVVGGLALLGIAFLFLHYFIMHSVFSHPEMWKAKDGTGPPEAFFDAFLWFYFFMGVILVTACI